MEGFWREIRVALRSLLRTPGYTTAVICILAIAVGATTALFSIVHGVLLKPLPYRDPERLVLIDETSKALDRLSVSYPDFLDWRDRSKSFAALGAWKDETFNLSGLDRPERVKAWMFSAGLLRLLGVTPALGREFTPEEDRPGGMPVALVTNTFWRTHLGGDAAAVGRTLSLDGKPHVVVGVLPRRFRFPGQSGAAVVVPLGQLEPELNARGVGPGIIAIGRLARGVTLTQARHEMETIGRAIHQEHADSALVLPMVQPMHGDLVRDLRKRLLLLMGAVVLMLSIAVANVANLALARGIARQRELAVRVALGAGRGRLVRELLVESGVLGLCGGILGMFLAVGCADVLLALRPESLGPMADLGIDGTVLAFAFVASVGSGLLFGTVPALMLTEGKVSDALRATPADADNRGRMRTALIIVEVALAFVLLVGAGLTMRAYMQLERAPLGFEPRSLLTFALTAPGTKYPTAEDLRVFRQQLATRFAALPGVSEVALGRSVPMDDDYGGIGLKLREAPRPEPGELTIAVYYPISPGYIKSMGIALLAGREFTPSDGLDAPSVAIIDETLASRFFPRQDPLGRWISNTSGTRAFQIVGVAKHVVHFGTGQPERTPYQMYYPIEQTPAEDLGDARRLRVVLRATVPPLSLAAAVQAEVSAIDPDQPIFDLSTMEHLAASTMNRERFIIVLLGTFAGLAIVLAATGLYAVISYDVSRRTHEIGVRMALGANAGAVQRMVVRQGVRLALAGLAAGLVASIIASRLATSLVSGVRPLDPATYVAVAALLVIMAVVASWMPARRVTRVEPAVALRAE
ncbi:MAG: ABC transporter permease [Deltaproteobacteria bacterium]|nr:MAG: ABC transporter permease [Deltaproteobacteria bacterium]